VRAFVDTNVLVYFFDQSEPVKRERSDALLEAIEPVLSAQVLSEFYTTVTRKVTPPLTQEQALRAVRNWSRLDIVPITSALVASAIETSQRHQLSYWDGLIIEAAVAAGCNDLYTEDLNAGATLRGVTIRNPFA
jgi:predicted nucleic acid-binding protein